VEGAERHDLGLHPDQRVRLQTVAFTVERALIEEPGRAVIAAGFLRDHNLLAHWPNQFVTPPETRPENGHGRSSGAGA